ncbi:MAG: carboxypeptidase M32 [Chloroflexi bacterium]|jgi:carboxypeptidase Taq|nr:carboxypeptidase M32 [Chloroflexota bacterium]MBT3669306.1 carboxypeptidase M32 [Chloroflexota bacterium]MBT4003771.1 carboxypeptidase M32 [Chloroflexota bacterium]MBT4306013.1 carboxypeptidase M32 [Chloroflexota bacterium]MBT4532657.1 carboxypeptidase M32 [Chloroflexota bacterium]
MKEKLEKLKSILAETQDLGFAGAVLSWDQETYMPNGGAEARGHILGTLGKIAHQKFTSDEVGKLLEDLESETADLDPDSDDARLIKVTKREFEKNTKVPGDMIVEKANLTTASNMAWREARENNDFSLFAPHLEKLLDWNKRYVELFGPYDHIYDPLLDDYEPNMKTAEVKAIFDIVRPKQVEIIEAIAAKPEIDDSVLHQKYPIDAQTAMGNEIITAIGYDFNRGRMDTTHHPFSTTFGYGDNRITVRYEEDFFNPFLFAAMHEAGHAMYEQGVSKDLERTPLFGGTSLAIHESQSRLWENMVGRSKPFWDWYYPKLQERFPNQLENSDVNSFYKAINKVEPSYIRVEADEATYNLHIMLRMELEIDMMEGKIDIKDLPDAWNSRFEEYLGIVPDNDANGVLQDVHWSFGLYGYFSTYALGNLVSAQLWNRMLKDHPNVEEEIRAGNFTSIFNWMSEKVYRHGAKFDPQELVKSITGSNIDGDAYIQYLHKKFGDIYEL